jgi:LPXTG-site transpeptidase (sortase) family protein
MRRGDRISLKMPYGRFSYSVLGVRVVDPSNGKVLHPGSDDQLVLTTCTPLFSSKRRLIVTARLERSSIGGPAPRPIPTEPSPAL